MAKDFIICEICQKQFRRVTRTHLLKHQLSTKEYQTKFPNAKLICDEISQIYSENLKQNNPMDLEENRKKVSEKLTGREFSKEHRRNISIAASQRTWMDDIPRRERQSQIAYEYLVPAHRKLRESGWTPTLTDEGRQKLSNNMIGNTRWINSPRNKGMKLNLTPEQRANRSRKRTLFLATKGMPRISSLEINFVNWLENQNIQCEQQKKLDDGKHSWLYDVYIPELNLLVEIDGEYWHLRKNQLHKDVLKTKFAKKLGFNLLRLSSDNLNFSLIVETQEYIENHSYNILYERGLKLGVEVNYVSNK
jgi:hypothetical protein